MALLRRKAPVETEEPQVEETTVEQKEIIDGSKLFTQKFREDFESQWQSVEQAYATKIKTLPEESDVYKKLNAAFAKTQVRYDYYMSFINEIVNGEHTADMVSFKLTKGASAFLRFSEASAKASDFSLVQTIDDIQTPADLFSKLSKSTFSNEEIVINIPKGVFAALRYKFSTTFKKFVAQWIKTVENIKVSKQEEEQPKPQPTPTKTETKRRSSTAAPRPKPKKEESTRPPKVVFIGIIVGHEITEDNKYTFTILDTRNKETFDITGKMSDGLYLKTFHNYADKCAEGVVIPVVCCNWHEQISNSPCMALYYDEEDYKEFDESYDLKVADLKAMFEEYHNR